MKRINGSDLNALLKLVSSGVSGNQAIALHLQIRYEASHHEIMELMGLKNTNAAKALLTKAKREGKKK